MTFLGLARKEVGSDSGKRTTYKKKETNPGFYLMFRSNGIFDIFLGPSGIKQPTKRYLKLRQRGADILLKFNVLSQTEVTCQLPG